MLLLLKILCCVFWKICDMCMCLLWICCFFVFKRSALSYLWRCWLLMWLLWLGFLKVWVFFEWVYCLWFVLFVLCWCVCGLNLLSRRRCRGTVACICILCMFVWWFLCVLFWLYCVWMIYLLFWFLKFCLCVYWLIVWWIFCVYWVEEFFLWCLWVFVWRWCVWCCLVMCGCFVEVSVWCMFVWNYVWWGGVWCVKCGWWLIIFFFFSSRLFFFWRAMCAGGFWCIICVCECLNICKNIFGWFVCFVVEFCELCEFGVDAFGFFRERFDIGV